MQDNTDKYIAVANYYSMDYETFATFQNAISQNNGYPDHPTPTSGYIPYSWLCYGYI